MDYEYKIYRYSQDRKPDSHFHENYEIHLALNNEGTFFVRERSYSLRYGTAFILGQFEIHRCFSKGSADYDRYIIQFPKTILTDLSTQHSDLVHIYDNAPVNIAIPEVMLGKILKILSVLTKPYSGEFGEDIQRNLCFANIILMFAKQIKANEIVTMPEVKSTKRVEDILQYIHNHYQDDLNMDALSSYFFISKSRLNQIFREATAFSIGDYIITYRVQKACVLLQKGLRVQDVGEMVGFHKSTHFIRTFKKRIGVSPGDFAKGVPQ